MTRLLHTGLFAGCLLGLTVAGAEADQIRLRSADLECVVRLTDSYLAQEKDPVVIFLANCSRPAAEQAQPPLVNSLPSVPTVNCATCSTTALILRRAQVRCLQALRDAGLGSRPREEVLDVDFGPCASGAPPTYRPHDK